MVPPPTVARPSDAAIAGIDAAALARFVDDAARTHSDALVLMKDGKVLVDRRFTKAGERPIETMSITKSIAALAIGLLIDDGVLPGDDVPIHRYFPEWKEGRKEQVTLLQVLTHCSGVDASDDSSDIWGHPDFVKLALDAAITTEPGKVFHYNNKAVQLLAGVVEEAAHVPLDVLLARRLFAPLGITTFEWLHDPAGHPTVMSGLKLRAIDVAKIGELLRRGGSAPAPAPNRSGVRVLSEREVAKTVSPASKAFPWIGRLWWIVADGENASRRIGYAARGYFGQELLVLPERGVVAVRLRAWSKDATAGADDFPDFEARVRALFGA